MRRILLPLLFLSCALPAFAQDEAGSKDHPSVPRISAGYVIHSYNATDFDSTTFAVGEDKTQSFEGKHWRIGYAVKDGAPKKTPSGELNAHVDVSNDGEMYNIEIIEQAAMAQQVVLTAAELAKALSEKGSVAVHNILFDTGKATIKPESSAALAPIGAVLKADPALRLEIQGHTDNVGAKAANQTLSQARAAAVRDYLIKTFAITPDRLTATGLGDTKPVADNATDAGRAQNRRVALVKLGAKFPAALAPATSEWTGRVTSGMMAIGGETTGIVIVTAQDQLELQPADQAMRQRLQQLNGKTVTIRGILETRPGVEVKTRRIIKVSEIVERS